MLGERSWKAGPRLASIHQHFPPIPQLETGKEAAHPPLPLSFGEWMFSTGSRFERLWNNPYGMAVRGFLGCTGDFAAFPIAVWKHHRQNNWRSKALFLPRLRNSLLWWRLQCCRSFKQLMTSHARSKDKGSEYMLLFCSLSPFRQSRISTSHIHKGWVAPPPLMFRGQCLQVWPGPVSQVML